MKKRITENEAKDAGLAIVLILLLLVLLAGRQIFLVPAVVCLVIVMAMPNFFVLWAKIWFGFSHILGTIVSKVLLSVVFCFLVVPVGVVRRVLGADSMMMKPWKKGEGSVFVEKDHAVTKLDIEKPY